jgi:hypothetical protein
MIELLIAALIQVGTLTTTPTDPAQTTAASSTTTTTTTNGTAPGTGGTGTWDDGN